MKDLNSSALPNILWILTDQQPASTVGACGNPTIRTPNLDRLVREGVCFERAFVASYPCSPSRASLLTGLYAHRHGVVTNDVLLDESIPSLGNICAQAGYATAYFGKWHLGGSMSRSGEGRYSRRVPNAMQFTFEETPGGTGEDEPRSGFRTWIGGWRHYRAYLRQVGFAQLVDQDDRLGAHIIRPSGPDSEHSVSLIPEEHHVESFIAASAQQFIRESAKSGAWPFAAVVSFYGPHLPVAPPRPWDTLYSLETIPEPVGIGEDLSAKPRCQSESRVQYAAGWTRAQYLDYVSRYWGFVSYIDVQIGRVLAALEETGQAENTIVVFTSDHGDMLGEHGLIYKLSGAVYDVLMRVPLIVRYPRAIAADTSNRQLISNIDVLPSVLEFAGLDCPPDLDGRSFCARIADHQATHRRRIYTDVIDKGLMVRDGRWKYGVHWALDDLDELYDLESDPHEQENLALQPSYRERVEQMRQQIVRWLHQTQHPYAGPIGQRILAGS